MLTADNSPSAPAPRRVRSNGQAVFGGGQWGPIHKLTHYQNLWQRCEQIQRRDMSYIRKQEIYVQQGGEEGWGEVIASK